MLDKKEALEGYDKFHNIEKDNNYNNIRISDYEFLETIGIGKYFINHNYEKNKIRKN
jgi:hypothetical protein